MRDLDIAQPCSHLRDRCGLLHLHLRGAGELWVRGVQDLHSQSQHEAGTEGHTLPQALIQVLVLVQQCVVACRAVHVYPGWTEGRQEACSSEERGRKAVITKVHSGCRDLCDFWVLSSRLFVCWVPGRCGLLSHPCLHRVPSGFSLVPVEALVGYVGGRTRLLLPLL